MVNEDAHKQKEVGPSTPVQVSGFGVVPNVGDILQVFPSAKAAKERAEQLVELHEAERHQKVWRHP